MFWVHQYDEYLWQEYATICRVTQHVATFLVNNIETQYIVKLRLKNQWGQDV